MQSFENLIGHSEEVSPYMGVNDSMGKLSFINRNRYDESPSYEEIPKC